LELHLVPFRHAALALPSKNPLSNQAQDLKNTAKRPVLGKWEKRSLDSLLL
jgi:hypothetical protein